MIILYDYNGSIIIEAAKCTYIISREREDCLLFFYPQNLLLWRDNLGKFFFSSPSVHIFLWYYLLTSNFAFHLSLPPFHHQANTWECFFNIIIYFCFFFLFSYILLWLYSRGRDVYHSEKVKFVITYECWLFLYRGVVFVREKKKQQRKRGEGKKSHNNCMIFPTLPQVRCIIIYLRMYNVEWMCITHKYLYAWLAHSFGCSV